MFKRILIANRGEIAVRIIKTAKQMGIETIAVYTPSEKGALHTLKADFTAVLTGDTISESYLNAQQIVTIAKTYGAEAIHPGYGFLSENNDFAELCHANGIIFIGPSAESIKTMGNKVLANQIAEECNIPLLKKVYGTPDELAVKARELKLPIIIKAALGGGGKGMRVIRSFDQLNKDIHSAAAEAQRYFGNDKVYIEEYIETPRHIEVQILADQHGQTIHLFDRECSIQRRHQKIVEEAPAPNLSDDIRQKLYQDAIKIAKHIGYYSAGTVEFLLSPDNQHYFLEMNTRIQVEHPVTEAITGIDLVKEQINIALNKKLKYSQKDIEAKGHAIEARIYAENPSNNFTPSFGKILYTHIPKHCNIRIDGGSLPGENLNPQFDPLLKKVITHADSREESIAQMHYFLSNYALFGVESNREYLIKIFEEPHFIAGTYNTKYCIKKKNTLTKPRKSTPEELYTIIGSYIILKYIRIQPKDHQCIWNETGYWRQQLLHELNIENNNTFIEVLSINQFNISIRLNNQQNIIISDINILPDEVFFTVNRKFVQVNYFIHNQFIYHLQSNGHKVTIHDMPEQTKRMNVTDELDNSTNLKAPMPGRIIDILVREGQKIKKGHPLMVLEAMKTENNLLAWKDTVIKKVIVNKGEQVHLDQLLIETN